MMPVEVIIGHWPRRQALPLPPVVTGSVHQRFGASWQLQFLIRFSLGRIPAAASAAGSIELLFHCIGYGLNAIDGLSSVFSVA